MKKLVLAAFVCGATVVFAKEGVKTVKSAKALAERIAELGGYVEYPGSQKGSIAFIDTQRKVALKQSFESVFGSFRRQLPVKIDFVASEAGDPVALKAKAKADFAVILIDEEKAPSLAVYPDDGYAVLNVAKYAKGFKFPDDQGLYEKRCVKGMLRAFVLLCNGGGSHYPGNVATAHNPEQLDLVQDKLPIDIQNAMRKYLEGAGVTPLRRSYYRKACQEGWAPAPTNDVQKAIWEEVHSIPDKPMKIEFDPATQKGKVTK